MASPWLGHKVFELAIGKKNHPMAFNTICRDCRGRTPLWLAVSGQHAATCSLLIGAGADPRVVDNQGVSVEELARKPDVKDIVALALAQKSC